MGFNIQWPNEDCKEIETKVNMELNLHASMFHDPNQDQLS